MADKIKKVVYYKIETAHRRGEGAQILSQLKEAGVNLHGFTGFPRKRKAQMDFIPEDNAAFRRAAKKMGITVKEKKTCFLIQGKDRAGAIAGILSKLAEGKINVTAVDAVAAGSGQFGAILWVKKKDVAKAAKILGAK